MVKNKLYWQYAASICLLFFAFIAYFVKANPAILSALDQPVSQLIRGNMSVPVTQFFLYITKFGNTVTIGILTALTVAICYKNRAVIEAVWVLINSALIAGAGNYQIKLFFNRPRPELSHLVHAPNSSFPSGHAMGSVLFYGTLIFLLPKFISNNSLRRVLQLILGMLIGLISLSRIYLGVHFPTDILGGLLLGSSWLLATYPIYKKQAFINRFKGHQK